MKHRIEVDGALSAREDEGGRCGNQIRLVLALPADTHTQTLSGLSDPPGPELDWTAPGKPPDWTIHEPERDRWGRWAKE